MIVLAFTSSLLASSLLAQQGYTNHAGNVIAGWPVALTATQVTLGSGGIIDPALPEGTTNDGGRGVTNGVGATNVVGMAASNDVGVTNDVGRAGSMIPPRGETYPLSIFPESEQRRIAVDFGQPRLPQSVRRAIDGAEKAMARSRKRAEKGFCTKEESEAFCAKSQTALRTYLDKQVESGVLTSAERKVIGR